MRIVNTQFIDRKVLTSANNKDLAKKIKLSSQKILKQRYNLYKALENK